ncbi:TPA: Wzz/FepE/Etk N-terminal domain-containing protein [Vibrio parahaemolyticus]|uniref:OtnB protein n=1 Tax=Vibrio parahaemolyticus TaxID=670 RepID=A0A5P9W9J8_VIBPH|nr:OtnB protein [Vibrio parahaemolyticus]
MEVQKEPNSTPIKYPEQPQSTDSEVDFLDLLKVLWRGKWVIILTTTIFAVGSVFYAINLPNIYKADALLAPAESSGGGDLSKMAGQLGGLAALAGVNIGSSESSQTELAVQVMKSRHFVDSFITRHELLVPLMAVNGWDLTSDTLIIDDEIYNPLTNEWRREAKGLRGVKPTAQEAYEVFRNNVLNISLDQESGLYTVSVQYYSPYVAQQWVGWLIEDINEVMRERRISETSKNLSYLKLQLQKTSIAEMQSTFYKLIEEQTKSLMLAEAQEEFVFKTIDPAVVPEVKSKPRRGLICIVATIFGFLISSISVILFSYTLKIGKHNI